MAEKCECKFSPISINEIEPGLFLSSASAARDFETLNNKNISHILSVDTCPLPRYILEMGCITTMFIKATDMPGEDLLSYFDDTYTFITNALEKGGKVIIHCYYGVSRSATIIIAYVMKKYKISYEEAFDRVKAKRSIISPNQGFISQLKIYQIMKYIINKSDMKYKLYRLTMAAEWMRKLNILPQNFRDLIQTDPGLPQSQPDPNVYRCRKCRRVLACKNNLISHPCTQIYFLEPLAWMNCAQTPQGKLYCPNCKSKVGSFSWVMGCECPCGDRVAPAFYLVPSKVDFCNVVKNIEVSF
ncbi:dual specificity protein phosphatase MPK-4 [Rhynchophorus ferrugineus]|uniref:dual specificity protein phosphatase MPK-4 n=1 Tax=Rhynchophorus ferrugineus TaxID=354439 RepID=UPI003FCE481E